MNLNDIIQSAQGGDAVNNLAQRFGLSPQQTQAALQAILPALSHGLQRTAQDPGALGGVVSEMASGAHTGSYADPRRRRTRRPPAAARSARSSAAPSSRTRSARRSRARPAYPLNHRRAVARRRLNRGSAASRTRCSLKGMATY